MFHNLFYFQVTESQPPASPAQYLLGYFYGNMWKRHFQIGDGVILLLGGTGQIRIWWIQAPRSQIVMIFWFWESLGTLIYKFECAKLLESARRSLNSFLGFFKNLGRVEIWKHWIFEILIWGNLGNFEVLKFGNLEILKLWNFGT